METTDFAAGYYWVRTDDSDLPSIAELRQAGAHTNSKCWWHCGFGAYDDAPQVLEVLLGPLEFQER